MKRTTSTAPFGHGEAVSCSPGCAAHLLPECPGMAQGVANAFGGRLAMTTACSKLSRAVRTILLLRKTFKTPSTQCQLPTSLRATSPEHLQGQRPHHSLGSCTSTSPLFREEIAPNKHPAFWGRTSRSPQVPYKRCDFVRFLTKNGCL